MGDSQASGEDNAAVDEHQVTTPVGSLQTPTGSLLPAVRPPADLAVRDDATLPDAVAQLVLALLATALAVAERSAGRPVPALRDATDVALGAAWLGYRTSARVAGRVAAVTAPMAKVVVDPPLLPASLTPRGLARGASDAWRSQRPAALHRLEGARDVVLPEVVDAALSPLDLTDVVLTRVDVDRIVRHALSSLDLTEVVLTQVDLERVATAVLDRLDLTTVARERVDLVGLAQEVVDAIDLPEIIRESTGSVASESVRAVRMQSIGADEGVQRLVDRMLAWRSGRDTQAPVARPDDSP